MGEDPTRWSALAFAAKAGALRIRRAFRDRRRPVPRHLAAPLLPVQRSRVRAPLYEGREPELERGKVQNLRLVARILHGLRIPADETFSFWRQVGRCRSGRGFVRGREIRQGCVVPSVGGGICGLTNGLYEAALLAGLEIVERHPHTRVLPGSAAERGMDATVSWNYLDLRLRAPFDWSVAVELTRDEIVVSIRAAAPTRVPQEKPGRRTLDLVGDCATCGREGCFRHRIRPSFDASRTAYWVDEVWPEFAAYVAGRGTSDLLLAPLRGRPAYAWEGVDATAAVVTLRYAWVARRFAETGASRQSLLLERAAALARRYAALTPYDADEIVLPISLLPFAWRDGTLGGRRFRVLATRPPLAEIHRRLDEAFARFPERPLLADFRASQSLIQDETDALAEAEAIVAPHRDIASLFGERAILLPWKLPMASWTRGDALGFPGPVVGRKGAYEVREAARRLGLTVVTPGRDLEGDGFWRDVPVRRDSPLAGTFAVVQPAIVENRPLALLRAQAAGCPVVATRACGLEGVVEVPAHDVDALVEALEALRPPASS